jgi:hypothetical protein
MLRGNLYTTVPDVPGIYICAHKETGVYKIVCLSESGEFKPTLTPTDYLWSENIDLKDQLGYVTLSKAYKNTLEVLSV